MSNGGPDQPDDDDPLRGGDIDDEIEKWTDAFDSLIGEPPPVRTSPATLPPPMEVEPPAKGGDEVEELFARPDESLGEALGEMLGSPPPLPEPTGEGPGSDPGPVIDDDILSSAPRPSRPSLRSMPALPEPELPPAPTDEEIFGFDAQKEFGAAIAGDEFEAPQVTAAGGALDGSAGRGGPRSDAAPEEVDSFSESTRIAEVDAQALLSAAGDPDATRRAESPLPPELAPETPLVGKAKQPARRGPAIVRRDELPRAAAPEPAGDYDAPQSTKIADAEAMEQFAAHEPSEELRFDQAPPGAPKREAPAVELDDSFYDDIEIGGSAAAEPQAVAPEPTPEPPPSQPVRRVTSNVVRRQTPVPGIPRIATPIVETPAATIEMEADEPEMSISVEPAPVSDSVSAPAPAPAPVDDFEAAFEAEPEPEPVPAFEAEPEPVPVAADAAPAAPVIPEDAAVPVFVPTAPGYESGAVPALALPDLSVDPSRFRFPEAGAAAAPPATADEDPAAWTQLLERELALTEEPAELASLRHAAGRAALAAGDVTAARDHFEEALNADAQHLPSVRALRRLLTRVGDVGTAAGYLEQEIGLLPDGAERRALRAYRADLLVAAGEQDLARVAFGELTDTDAEDVRALLAQIELAWADERDEELPAVLEKTAALVADPELTGALRLLLGRVQQRLGRAEAARAAYAAAAQTPTAARAAALACARLERQGERPADAAAWEARLAEGTDPGLGAAIHRRAAVEHRRAGAEGAGFAELEAALAVAPGDPLVLETLADAYTAAGRAADALRIRLAWADVEPEPTRRTRVLRRAALAAQQLGDPATAAEALRRAAETDPDDALGRANLLEAQLASGDSEGALSLLRASAIADPLAAWPRVRAARLLEAAGRHDEAIAELETARTHVPDSAVLGALLHKRLVAAGRLDAAARLAAELADADTVAGPQLAAQLAAARAVEVLAAAGHDPEAWATAQAAWAKVLETDAGGLSARLAAVRCAEARGDVSALAEALAEAQAQSRDPSFAEDLALRRALVDAETGAQALEQALALSMGAAPRVHAHLYAQDGAAGRWEEVSRRAAERISELPDSPWRDALAFAAASASETGEGAPLSAPVLDALGLVATRRPGFIGARVLLERAYRRQGDPTALAEEQARVLGLDPTMPLPAGAAADPPALRFARLVQLGELFERRVGQPDRARAAYAAALELRPDDPLAQGGFARACEAAGDVRPLADRALAELKRAEDRGSIEEKIAAYEALARVDGELRGDPASALFAWETIAELDPTRMVALRVVERAAAADGRDADLLAVSRKLAPLYEAPGDVAAAAMMRARLADALGHATEAAEDWRRALEAHPTERQALFRLEMRSRDAGVSEELAVLEEQVARFFTGDARAQAAFLTRAGECLVDLGRPGEAGVRFRAASDCVPGHLPALRAWRRAALGAELWPDAIDSAEREATAARADAERARLYHLAGVVAMDKAMDGEKATENLRRVLALDPRHDDALARLRTLYGEQARYEDLAQLLGARVELERDLPRLIELHMALAGLHRDFLGDRERAKAHLRAVIQRDPRQLAAVAALSDIAWEQGEWQEAADSLIQRAKLERNPRVLKEIFYRLGTIYAERLPDVRWAAKAFERVLQLDPNDDGALEQVSRLAMSAGDWRAALAATVRLVGMVAEPAQKIEHLLRIARIQLEGYRDPAKAEDALRRALDVDPADARALAALAEFYTAQGDMTSLRVHLDRVAGHMRLRLRRDAHDGVAYRVIARALAARARAGVAGSIEAARCAAELAHALGAAEPEERALAGEALRHQPSAKGLGELAIDEQLFHPSIPNGFRQVFRLLHDTLAKRQSPDLRRWGVGRADRLPKSGHPLRDLAQVVAAELGIDDLDVYVSSAQPTALGVELTSPLSLVIGAHLAHADKAPQVRFALGRALKLATSYMAVPARLTPEELGALLAGIIRQYDPNFSPPGISAGLVAEEQQKLGRLISKRLRDEVYPFATEISGTDFDSRQLWAGVQHTGNRAGLICAGSALAGLVVLLRIGNYKDIASSRGDTLIEEFMRFAVSEEHCEIRRNLGG